MAQDETGNSREDTHQRQHLQQLQLINHESNAKMPPTKCSFAPAPSATFKSLNPMIPFVDAVTAPWKSISNSACLMICGNANRNTAPMTSARTTALQPSATRARLP